MIEDLKKVMNLREKKESGQKQLSMEKLLTPYVFWSRWKHQPFLSTADALTTAEEVDPQSCVNELTLIYSLEKI